MSMSNNPSTSTAAVTASTSSGSGSCSGGGGDSSSGGITQVIPLTVLNRWSIFQMLDTTLEQRPILRRVRLAYAFGETGLLATIDDKVYAVGKLRGIPNYLEMQGTPPTKLTEIEELNGWVIKDFVSGNKTFCLALTENGVVFFWGDLPTCYNCSSTLISSPIPLKVGGSLVGKFVTKVVACGTHMLALTKDGEVHSWGHNRYGQLGAVVEQEGIVRGQRNNANPGPPPRPPARAQDDDEDSDEDDDDDDSDDDAVVGEAAAVESWCKKKPIRIPQAAFRGARIVDVAVALGKSMLFPMSVALTANGSLYQWGYVGGVTKTSPSMILGLTDSGPYTKIFSGRLGVFALNKRGEAFLISPDNSDTTAVHSPNIHVTDIAATTLGEMYIFQAASNYYIWRKNGGKELGPLNLSSMNFAFAKFTNLMYKPLSPQDLAIEDKTTTTSVAQDVKQLWFWDNRRSGDVTFMVEGTEIIAHKFIVCLRSQHFHQMFNGRWAECNKSVIEIKDVKYSTFRAFLYFLYTDEVMFKPEEYQKVFDLIRLADCYLETGIKKECVKHLMKNLTQENVLNILELAGECDCEELESWAILFIVQNRKTLAHKRNVMKILIKKFGKEPWFNLIISLLRD